MVSKIDDPIAAVLANRYWRLNNLYWIVDAHGQKVKFKMNWAQEEFYARMWWLNCVLKVRKIGISTFSSILALDTCLFNSDKTAGVIDLTEDDAKKKLSIARYAYEHLDDPDDQKTCTLGGWVKKGNPLITDAKGELGWANGSRMWAGITFRGSSPNLLHVSELGAIAERFPDRAKEIAAGSFNSVQTGNVIIAESTHEGGRYGLNYELIRAAQATGSNPTAMDWRFHFFPWWREPQYTLPLDGRELAIPATLHGYFDRLQAEAAVLLTPAQKHWYVKKAAMPDVDMARQYPGTPEEALAAQVAGAIYGKEMAMLRNQGRVCDFGVETRTPLFTFWDIAASGPKSDYVGIWFLQFVGRDFLAVDFITGQGETASHYAGRILEKEREFGVHCAAHFLPHDGDSYKDMSGKTSKQMLEDAGLRNVKIVPITPSLWASIQTLRALLPRFYFHAKNCNQEVKIGKRILPSGLGCIEGYHSKIEANGGKVSEVPVHDAASHGADALRTFSEAYSLGMLDGYAEGGLLVQEGAGEHTLSGIRALGRGEKAGLTVSKGDRFRR